MWEAIGILAGSVLLVVEFVKKKLKLSGWIVTFVSLIVSLIAASIYGGAQSWELWKIIVTGIGLTVGTGASFDIVKEFCSFVGTKKS